MGLRRKLGKFRERAAVEDQNDTIFHTFTLTRMIIAAPTHRRAAPVPVRNATDPRRIIE
jgi:hypothetical protein